MTRLTKPNARTVLIAILLLSSTGPPRRRSNNHASAPSAPQQSRINQCWRRNAPIQRSEQILLPNRRRLRGVERTVGTCHHVVLSCMSSLADLSLATLEPSRRSLPTPPAERATAAEARPRATLLDITGTFSTQGMQSPAPSSNPARTPNLPPAAAWGLLILLNREWRVERTGDRPSSPAAQRLSNQPTMTRWEAGGGAGRLTCPAPMDGLRVGLPLSDHVRLRGESHISPPRSHEERGIQGLRSPFRRRPPSSPLCHTQAGSSAGRECKPRRSAWPNPRGRVGTTARQPAPLNAPLPPAGVALAPRRRSGREWPAGVGVARRARAPGDGCGSRGDNGRRRRGGTFRHGAPRRRRPLLASVPRCLARRGAQSIASVGSAP
jgi:hypothetical protein